MGKWHDHVFPRTGNQNGQQTFEKVHSLINNGKMQTKTIMKCNFPSTKLAKKKLKN